MADDPHSKSNSQQEPSYNQNSTIRSRWKTSQYPRRINDNGKGNGAVTSNLKWLNRKSDSAEQE